MIPMRSTGVLAAAVAAAALLLAAPPGRGQESESMLDTLVAMLSTQATEGLIGIERQLENLDPALRRAAAPFVAGLIVQSRDDAVAQGVEVVPPGIREELAGYVPAAVLDRARWCAGCGGTLSLQQSAFRLGYAPAITLDHVIVFRDREVALEDPSLWVHELKHVMQYQEWGVEQFASRYVEDYEAVEREAAEYRWEWVKRTDWLERRKARRSSAPY